MFFLSIENLCDIAEQSKEDQCYEAFQLFQLSAAASYSSWILEIHNDDDNNNRDHHPTWIDRNDRFDSHHYSHHSNSTLMENTINNIISSTTNITDSILSVGGGGSSGEKHGKGDDDSCKVNRSRKYRSISKPTSTSFHSGCLVQNSQMNWCLFVSGCTNMSDDVVIQAFDLDTRTWIELFHDKKYCFDDDDEEEPTTNQDDNRDDINENTDNIMNDDDYDEIINTYPLQIWGHSVCYSPLTKLLYVFGGIGNDDGYNDKLFEFSLDERNWKWRRTKNELENSSTENTSTDTTQLCRPPEGRQGHRCVYLTNQHKIVIFGGYSVHHLDDFFVYDIKLNIWSHMEECGNKSNRLSPREVFSMVLNEQRQSIVFFAGKDDNYRYNDVCEFSLVTKRWYLLHPGGDKRSVDSNTSSKQHVNTDTPSARSSHSCVMIEKLQRMVIFGGYNGDHWLNDCWMFDFALKTWTKVELFPQRLSKNSLRTFQNGFSSHVSVFDPLKSEMLSFGGWSGDYDNNALWSITFPTLNELDFQSKLGNLVDKNVLSDIMIVTCSFSSSS
ncbi:hypothetical protein FDP41_011629 [Naegleria fowleri]|uniref:Uncharacterized protein n=1 Tax=Naegleria fowleri TaxID=5763 RepID=A0A6A5CBR0_NAEFO|nr:uncharacterized protein FDP41_011629 [Naegleria fowleri]KAF0982699.1 hypothetical protein FDP41_011629 [Naegleria fowleri]